MPGKPESRVVVGPTLFDQADDLRIQVPTSCRRSGRCRECVVEVTAGAEHLGAPTQPERFLRPPFRLACQAELDDPAAPVEFSVLRRRLRIVAGDVEPRTAPIDPAVRVADGMVCWHGEPIEPARGGLHGVAIDVGTTTVALELVDLRDGRTLEVVTLENPQRFGGSDVINRISYESTAPGELRYALRKALNSELRALYRRFGIDRREVYEIVVVGNSTMRDIFFGVEVTSIGERPYKSLTEHELIAGGRSTTALTARAHELGLWSHPQARVWGAPLVASHVGADVGADLVATGLDGSGSGPVMLVDVGTNTEVVLAAGGRILAASCPAGPAFEGGELSYGMQASDGAIEAVRSAPGGGFEIDTIGGFEPRGICGSGLIDLVAELRRAGGMTAKGVFAERAASVMVAPEAGITFSRADGSALAQAKAANTVGQWILLRELGVKPAEVERVYLAGGFASYINVGNAIEIGFLAPVAQERVAKVGNASLRGARELLLSVAARERLDPAEQRLEPLLRRIEHVELERTPDFFELFVDGCQFKPFLSEEGALAA